MGKWMAILCFIGSLAGGGLAAQATTLSEGFDDITTLTASGWVAQNNSSPLGTTGWFQGNSAVFPAQTGGTGTEYIGANFNNASGTGHISNWLISPEIEFMSGKTISFYTRTPAGSLWPDRLELRLNLTNNGTNVGTLSTDVGDFTTVAVEVNATLLSGGYPETWTYYSYTYTGATLNGRFAFRYNVTGGGPSGANSNYIGIDTVEYNFAPPSVTINQSVAQNDPTTNGNVLFDVVFSESVTGFDGSDVNLAASTAPGTLTANVSGSGTNYTVTVFGMTGAGDVVASIVAAAATGVVSAQASLASTSTDNTVSYSPAAPTVTINQATTQTDPTGTSPIAFTVVFSENVTGFANTSVDLSASTAGGTLVASLTGSGSTYTVSVTGMTTAGTVVASISAGAATGVFTGLTSLASTSTDNSVTWSGSGGGGGGGGGGGKKKGSSGGCAAYGSQSLLGLAAFAGLAILWVRRRRLA